jgi:hypothetical protein
MFSGLNSCLLNLQIGADVHGTIDGAFDSGYLMTAVVNGQLFRGVLFAPVSKSFPGNELLHTWFACFFLKFSISGTWSDCSKTSSTPSDPDELGHASPAAATAGTRHPGPRPGGAAGDGLCAAGLRPARTARGLPSEGRQVRAGAGQQRPARCCAHAGRAWRRGQVSGEPLHARKP